MQGSASHRMCIPCSGLLLDADVVCRHTMEELQQLVETAKQAVPGVDAAIAAAIDRKLNPVSHLAYNTSGQSSVLKCCHHIAIGLSHALLAG